MNELDLMLQTLWRLLEWKRSPSQVKEVDGEEKRVVEVCVDDIQDLITLLRYGNRE